MVHASRILLACLATAGCATRPGEPPELGATIRGRLTDDFGRPIEGVLVNAIPLTPGNTRHDSTESDRDGRFVLSLEPGSCALEINRGPGTNVRWEGANTVVPVGSTVDLVLVRTPWIEGRVFDATTGRPLRGATVMVGSESGTPVTWTDEAGRYEQCGLSEGSWEVTVAGRERKRSALVEIRRGVTNTHNVELRVEDEIRDDDFQVSRWVEANAPPVWFDLGGINYFSSGADEAASAILSFRAYPRWFRSFKGPGMRRPNTIEAVLLEDQGASLDLQIAPDELDPRLLRVRVVLRAGGRALEREVEHRHTNVLPFLFALRADGQTVASQPVGWMKFGGINGMVDLVPAGGERTWDLVVTARSLEPLLPRPLPHKVEVAVAFSERQHEPVDMLDEDTLSQTVIDHADRQEVLVRSPVVTLIGREGSWYPGD